MVFDEFFKVFLYSSIMKIGDVKLKNNLILAPMAGYTDLPFRILAKRGGAGLVCSEMVSVEALKRNNQKTKNIIKTNDDHPNSIQIFGNNLDNIKQAVKKVEPLTDIIGFNCGCPKNRIKKDNCGAALLDNPNLIIQIVKTIKKTTNKPLLMKIRLGNNSNCDYLKLCKEMQLAGANAIIVHGRTAKQGYSGKANWDTIKEIKENTKIPIIANGDVIDGKSAKECLKLTNADGLAIGRAAMGNPTIFKRINHFLKTGEELSPLTKQEKLNQFIEYLNIAKELNFNRPPILAQAMVFCKCFQTASKIRTDLMKTKSISDIKKSIESYLD